MIRRRGGDAIVAELLRSLPVPEHSDEFFDRLRATLSAESDGDVHDLASTVIDLSVRRAAQETRRPRLQRVLQLATAPAAAVACFALVVGGAQLARRTADDTQRPDGAPIADAAPRTFTSAKSQRFVVPKAVAAKTGLHVHFTTWSKKAGNETFDAVISPTGDYHVVQVGSPVVTDANGQTAERTVMDEKTARAVTQTGLPPGPPDDSRLAIGKGSPIGALSRDLGAAVRAIAAEDPARVTRGSWHGRTTLKYSDPVGGGKLFRSQELEVDAKTGVPITVKQYNVDRALVLSIDVDELDDSYPLGDGASLPATSTSGATQFKGFVTTTLYDATATLGYAPLVPVWLPEGYTLARVASANVLPTFEDQKNPQHADVLSMVYRNGLSSYTVTTRRSAHGGLAAWTDPLLDGTPVHDWADVEHVDSGALAGADLHVGVYPLVWPHVWAEHEGVVVTIAGDLTRAELLQVARSLQAYKRP